MQDKIKEILYRPFVFKTQDTEKVVIIIGSELQITTG